jgi:hypothetical protein
MGPHHGVGAEASIKAEDFLRVRLEQCPQCPQHPQPQEWQGVKDADIKKPTSAMSASGAPRTPGRQLWRF